MSKNSNISEEIINRFEVFAQEGMKNAANGFATMLGEKLSAEKPKIRQVPICEIATLLGGPETEAVGIYLNAEGQLAGQFMLVIPFERSLELSDLLLDVPDGTTRELGTLERSALGEVGNLVASFFLNTFANMVGIHARPSPPAVMVDMVGAIMDIIAATCGCVSDHVLLMETRFVLRNRSIETSFWVIPDMHTLEMLGLEV
jgi:chemotaxis protein CheC